MTVDEILATGQYKSRAWGLIERCREACPGNGLWVCAGHYEPWEHLRTDQVKLMIERDLHRDVCPGLIDCGDHPVPIVEIDGPIISGTGCYYVRGVKSWARVEHKHDLERAIDAARALAVGE